MFRQLGQFVAGGFTGGLGRPGLEGAVTHSGQLDGLVALEHIGSRRSFARGLTLNFPPSHNRGRRECRAPDAPAAARVV